MKTILCVVVMLLLTAAIVPAQAQTQLRLLGGGSEESAELSSGQQSSERDLEELIRLLSNPAVVKQLQQQLSATANPQSYDVLAVSGFENYFQGFLIKVDKRAGEIIFSLSGLPRLAEALSVAWADNMAGSNFLQSAIYVIIFLFGGFGLEWLYWCYLSGTLKRIELSKPKTYGRILKIAALRALLLFGSTALFVFGSIGLFIGFEWSPFIGNIVLSLLVGVIAMRFIAMISVFVLAPRVDDLRLLPLDGAAAQNIYRWILVISGIGIFGYLMVDTLNRMAVESSALLAVEMIAGLIFTSVLIAAIWKTGSRRRDAYVSSVIGDDADSAALLPAPGNFKIVMWSALILVAFILWLFEIDAVMWTLVILFLLFPTIKFSCAMVDYIFDNIEDHTQVKSIETGGEDDNADEAQSSVAPSRYQLYRPIAVRLVRFLLVVITLITLGVVWDVRSVLQSTSNTFSEKVFGIFIDIVFALLIAEFIWAWGKTAIDRKLSTIVIEEGVLTPGPEARLATLLPMIRKILMATIVIMVSLVLLSSLGINIGPILAGAGVLGIALGFGAQSLVKDIVSGIFFLIEDAFRVGEYIEVGDLRGTVDSVSIRSLRVRHHLGAIHTIPFGELKSLTNHSRDWVIMKLEFRVPFDTDIKLIKNLIKQVNAKLKENPDYGHFLIEPLKSQGVRRMEEFNMVVGVKFMAVPGQQWLIRRDAYQQIRDIFKENGIEFAQRNVTVEVVSDRELTRQETEAAASAAQESVEQQVTAPAPDEP
ncbi:MAG: mechanosensitive ion channel [Gammaproteobacteria bacterium]|nr:mechanosensitive ion channel [Gammaproteobacteria bacterium]